MSDIVRPFIPYDAFDWLKKWIRPSMSVFEYGSGMSTLWFGENTNRVIAVENHPGWYDKIKEKLIDRNLKNVEYVFRDDGEEYSKLIHRYEGSFDLVFIDGRFRKECMEQCFEKASKAVLFDNSDAHHYQDAYDVMKTFVGGTLIDFYSFGLNPYTGSDLPEKWQASVFVKAEKDA